MDYSDAADNLKMKPTSTLGVGCLLIENDKVLLVKPNYGKAKNHWIMPGGFIENGEPIDQAGLRELKEETGQHGKIISSFCVRYRLEPSDVYWVLKVLRSGETALTIQSEELIDVQFLPIEFAIKSAEVRPMTRYFIECSLAKNPKAISLPQEFEKNNFVYFFER